MFLNKDADPSKDGVETKFPICSLPELYAVAENLNKESKKSSRLKTLSISPSEAQKIISQNLNAMSFTSKTDLGEKSQPVFKDKVIRKDEEKPPSMTELLHHSLLTGSLSQVEKLWKSQQRLAHYGIPPPMHTFPYEIIISESKTLATTRKKSRSPRKLSTLSSLHVKADKFYFGDRISEYLLIEPGTLSR